MIRVTSNAKAVSMGLGKVGRELRNAYHRGLKKTVRRGKSTAIRLAPSGDTGDLRKGIFHRLFKDRAMLYSSVPGSFPYNKWVNASPGFKTLNFPKGAWIPPSRSRDGSWVRILPPGSNASYGLSPGWVWSGTRGFFDIAFKQMDREIISLFTPELERALKTK